MIIMGDFNAKSELWGKNKVDSRGQEVIDIITKHVLTILNNPNCAPTYNPTTGTSW